METPSPDGDTKNEIAVDAETAVDSTDQDNDIQVPATGTNSTPLAISSTIGTPVQPHTHVLRLFTLFRDEDELKKPQDFVLLMAKCCIPALFVMLSATIAISLNNKIDDNTRTATEHFAAGALIVTWGFEIAPGYHLRKPGKNELDISLVIGSFLGTFLAGSLFAATQDMWPYSDSIGGDDDCDELKDDCVQFADCVSFMLAFFVDGVVLAQDNVAIVDKKKSLWQRIKPTFSVITLVVSIDNAVDGIGMFQQLDDDTMHPIFYYLLFVGCIFAGGIFTFYVMKIPIRAIQAFWFAFGAFAILDSGLQLAKEGLTTSVLAGFLFVWAILLLGGNRTER